MRNLQTIFFGVILVLLLTAIPGFSHAQNSKLFSFKSGDITLKQALAEIEKETGMTFSYNPEILPLTEIVSLNFENSSLTNVLNVLFNPVKIDYKISGKQIILKKSKEKEKEQTETDGNVSVYGYIRDSKTGEILIGVNVYDPVTYRGTTSNSYGYYSITLPSGNKSIRYSMLGYSISDQKLELTKDIRKDIQLTESGIDMQAVEVLSEKEIPGMEIATTGEINLTANALKRMAGFAGNTDVLKTLQMVPGISAFGDGSAFYFVRGGTQDQNLLMIDDAPVFNPAHLFGFFTAIAPDAVKDVKAYKGDFPASFGGRLSSVIDIRARDGNMNKIGFSGNLGIYTSDLTLEGPVIKEKSSFIFSGRKSNLNWLNNNPENGRSFTIDFFDLNAKLNFKINNNNRLFFTFFTGKDDFSRITNGTVKTFGIDWDNTTATLRWNHIFNPRLFSNTTWAGSRYNYYLYISRQEDDYWKSSIETSTIKTDFTWYHESAHTIRFGAELALYRSNPGNVHFSDEETQRFAPWVPHYKSLAANFYISDEIILTDNLQLRAGLRFSSWRNLGETNVYLYDESHQVYDTITVAKGSYYSPYYNLEPRLNLVWNISKSINWSAGYSRTAQYLQMLSNSVSPFTSLEVWAPSGPNILPQKADQVTSGFLFKLPDNLSFSADVFFKKLHNQIDYADHANMLYNPLIEGELRYGFANAHGVELLLRRTEGRVAGWIGYTWSKVSKQIDGINNNQPFPAFYDRPHSFLANIIFQAGKRLDISANWCYLSGQAFTSPVSFMQYNGYVVPVYGSKHNDRLPDYHRLDVSFSLRLNKPERRYNHTLVLAIYNLYGRSNPFNIGFNKIMNSNGDFVVPSDMNGNYEIISTQLSVAGIIPSVNYTFKFR